MLISSMRWRKAYTEVKDLEYTLFICLSNADRFNIDITDKIN